MKKNILFLSHTMMGGPFVVGSHHLAKELSKNNRVLHVSTPVTILHKLKRDELTHFKNKKAGNLYQIERDFYEYVPFNWMLPWQFTSRIGRILKYNISNLGLKKKINKAINEVFGDELIDVILIDQPTLIGLEKHIKYKKIYYRPTDVYHLMLNDLNIVKLEENLINKSNGLICTSYPVSDFFDGKHQLPKLLLENGVDVNHFSRGGAFPEEYKQISKNIAVYVGALDNRFDFENIVRLATERKNVNIVLIGPISQVQIDEHLNGYGNIITLGKKNYADIPGYLYHADIALLPLNNNRANDGRSPMKIYEYIAAGLKIVSSETQELLRRKEDNVYFYNNTIPIELAYDNALRAKYIESDIEEKSWSNKAKLLEQFIEVN